MNKKIIAMIFVAGCVAICSVLIVLGYETYRDKIDQLQENKRIEQEKKENKETIDESDKRETNLDDLWQHIIRIKDKEIMLPIKYEELKASLRSLIDTADEEKIKLKNGETLLLNFYGNGKDTSKLNSSKVTVYGISTEKDIGDSCMSIQQIKTGLSYQELVSLYEQPVSRDEDNLTVIKYADPKSDMDISQQQITIYLKNNRIVGFGMYYDDTVDIEVID